MAAAAAGVGCGHLLWLVMAALASSAAGAEELACLQAGRAATGMLGLRPSDSGMCLPRLEPQLRNVRDYFMVLDVAAWESHHVASMIMGILLSEHMGYNVVFNDGPLRNKFNRPLVPLPAHARPGNVPHWLWQHGSEERREELGDVLACVADGSKKFSVVNMEAWNIDNTRAQDHVREGYMRGDAVGYYGQSGWCMPAALAQGVGNLYSHYQGLNAQPPPVWAAEGFSEADMVRCANASLGACTPQAGRGTEASCRIWCPNRNAVTIPLWAIHPTYDAGYAEEIIYNSNLDVSIQYVGIQEHERKVTSEFRQTSRPGPVLFYSWEPSALIYSLPHFNRHEVSRLFLPNSMCNRPHLEFGPPDSIYRCDYPQQSLQKLVSANMEAEAPFAFDFVKAFKITQQEIQDIMRGLFAADFADAPPEQKRQMVFDVACSWVQRAGRGEPLANSTQTSFKWHEWKRAHYWFAQIEEIEHVLSRNSILLAVTLVALILVERCCICSTLNLEQFICNICSPCRIRKKPQRMGSSVCALNSVGTSLSEDVDKLSRQSADVRIQLELQEQQEAAMTNGPCDVPCAQLCAETVWCKETDPAVTIGVFLSESCGEEVSIGYETEDGTAKAGDRYEAKKGELVFQPFELVKSVDITILDSQDWDAGTFFEFRLRRRNTEQLALGRCYKSRVQIIDMDAFPKSKNTSDAARNRMSKRGALFEHLWNEYARLRTNVWLALVARVYIALNSTIIIPLLQKFLLDNAVARAREDVDHQMVIILGALFFLSACFRRVAEHVVVKYSKGAAVAAELQMQLYTKLWMMSSLTRDTRLQPARWISATMRHTKDVAVDGWVAVAELVQESVRLLLTVLFTLLLSSDFFNEGITYHMIVPPVALCVIIPAAWWLGIEVRKPGQVLKREDVDNGMTSLYDGFNWLLLQGKDLVRLGRGHNSLFLEEQRRVFRRDVMSNCRAEVADNIYQLDTAWIVTWMATLMHVCFFVTGGMMLIESEHYGQVNMTAGTFVALMGNFKSFGQALRQLFQIFVRIEIASHALHKISELLNAETQEARHFTHQQACLDAFVPQFQSLNHTATEQIEFRNVSFAYENASHVIEHFKGAIQLGRIVALEDEDSADNALGGQITLLRLVAGDLMPTEGEVLIPPHLRVGIVETVPVLVGDSLLKNVTVLALRDTEEVAAHQPKLDAQAWYLARLLGMQAAPNSPDNHAIPTTAFITMTARVLLSDPDVLLVLTSRWQGGPWLQTLLRGLIRWQQTGLQALLGKDDPRDRRRQRSLLLTMDAHGLEYLEVGDVYSLIRLNSEGQTVNRADSQTDLGVIFEGVAEEDKEEEEKAQVVSEVKTMCLSAPRRLGDQRLRSWSMKEPAPNTLPQSAMMDARKQDHPAAI